MDLELRHLERRSQIEPIPYLLALQKANFDLFLRKAQQWLVERYPTTFIIINNYEHRDGGGGPRTSPRTSQRPGLIFVMNLDHKTDEIIETPIFSQPPIVEEDRDPFLDEYSVEPPSTIEHVPVQIGVDRRHRVNRIQDRHQLLSEVLINQFYFAVTNPPYREATDPDKYSTYTIQYSTEQMLISSNQYLIDALRDTADVLGFDASRLTS